mmetsp:Transcript_163428/g.397212  ORF Transcript_163428/g.397212 Transcript_163428/m.397212 type:complete len:453 (-) Transcript_163428:337-1695(-)
MREVLLVGDLLRLLLERQHLLRERERAAVGDGDVSRTLALQLLIERHGSLFVFAQRRDGSLHRLVVLLELLAHEALAGLRGVGHHYLHLPRHIEHASGLERHAAGLHVVLQVEAGAVSMTDALHPARRHQDLGVPAVGGVVCHLGAEVLTEPETLVLDAHLHHETVRPAHEVSKRLVTDDTALHGLAKRDVERLAVAHLVVAREERWLQVSNRRELRVRLVTRVHKVLDLRHAELTHAQQTTARGNLVAVGQADLCASKRHSAAVVLEQAAEVDEDALRRLRAHVTGHAAAGADGRLEHQVEGERLREVVAGGGRLDLEPLKLRVELRGGEGVGLRMGLAAVLALRLREHRVLHLVLEEVLQQLVRAVALAGLHVLGHEVGEHGDVAGDVQHAVRRERRRLELQHGLLQDEPLLPQAQHVVLHTATRRTEVKQTGDAAVNVERLHHEHTVLE